MGDVPEGWCLGSKLEQRRTFVVRMSRTLWGSDWRRGRVMTGESRSKAQAAAFKTFEVPAW